MTRSTIPLLLRPLAVLSTLILLLACSVSTPVQAQKPGSTTEYEVRAGGIKRSYLLYLPASYQPGKPMPLVVALHGGLGTGKAMAEISGFDRTADARGLIVAYPDGIGRGWNAGSCCGSPMKKNVDDVGFMRSLVADIKQKVAIDPKRVYGTGFSNGAMLVHRVACEAPDVFAAIAAVSGGPMVKDCKPSKGLPVLLIQGRADPRIPWDGGEFEGNYRPSIRQIVADLRVRNRCAAEETVVEQNDVVNCANGQDVQWCGLNGVGHQWAGGKTLLPRLLGKNTDRYNASNKITDFFLKHSAR
jgi:polyhydroxybutyrate depolymerase